MSRKLLLIFLLALFARALFFSVAFSQTGGALQNAFPAFDGYRDITQSLLSGNGFSRSLSPPFVPDSVRTPLYPLFIAGLIWFFKSYYAVLIAQIVLGGIIPLIAYRIAVQILADTRIATLIAFLLALEPFSAGLSSTIQVETFFAALFLAGLTLFLEYWKSQRWRTLAYTTGFFALATLARPTIQFLPLLLILAVFFLAKGDNGRATRHSLVVAAIFLLILAPWSIRNFVRFGNPALSVQYASVPYGYLVPSALALEKNIGFLEAMKQFYDGEGKIESVEEITLANAPFYKERATKILKKHPVGLIKSIGVTFLTFFTHDGYMDVLYRLGMPPSVRLERPAFTLLLESPQKAWNFVRPLLASPALFAILGRIAWVLITLFFVAGAIRYLRVPEQRAKGIFILLIILYFAVTTIAVGLSVNARFRFPVNALILTFAVYGASTIFKRIKFGESVIPSCLRRQVKAGIQKKIET